MTVSENPHRGPIPGFQQRRENTMRKPTHIAYIVTEPKEGSDRKPIWRAVGAIWPHKNGIGFDLVIHDQLSVSGRIVCTEAKEKPATTEQADQAAQAVA
jgi:hypothetical protein